MVKLRTKLAFDDFQALIVARHEWLKKQARTPGQHYSPRSVNWGRRDLALAAQGPVGYIAHLHTQWKRGDDVFDGEIYDEIADAIIYLMLLVAEMGGETSKVLARKFNVNAEEMGYGLTVPDYKGGEA